MSRKGKVDKGELYRMLAEGKSVRDVLNILVFLPQPSASTKKI
jgi:hypothetical protein